MTETVSRQQQLQQHQRANRTHRHHAEVALGRTPPSAESRNRYPGLPTGGAPPPHATPVLSAGELSGETTCVDQTDYSDSGLVPRQGLLRDESGSSWWSLDEQGGGVVAGTAVAAAPTRFGRPPAPTRGASWPQHQQQRKCEDAHEVVGEGVEQYGNERPARGAGLWSGLHNNSAGGGGGGGGGSGGGGSGGGGGGGSFIDGGKMTNHRQDAERSLEVVGGSVMETEEEEEKDGTEASVPIKRCTQEGGGAGAQGSAAAVAALETAGDGRANQRHRNRPQEEEQEEVFASHGVYEEYLAYDCRPPDDDSYTHNDSSGGMFGSGVGGEMEVVDGSSADLVEQGANTTVGAAGVEAAKSGRPRLDTPRRELRQEIMDRLFDELWARITPDLVSLLQQQRQQEKQQPQVAADAAGSVEMGEKVEEQGHGFLLKAPRDSMED